MPLVAAGVCPLPRPEKTSSKYRVKVAPVTPPLDKEVVINSERTIKVRSPRSIRPPQSFRDANGNRPKVKMVYRVAKTGARALMSSVNDMAAQMRGDHDALRELREEKKEVVAPPPEKPQPQSIHGDFGAIYLYSENYSWMTFGQLAVLGAFGCYFAGLHLCFPLILLWVVVSSSLVDYFSHRRLRSFNYVSTEIGEKEMIDSASSSGFSDAHAEADFLWSVFGMAVTSCSAIPPAFLLLEGVLRERRYCWTTDRDVRLLSNKNAKRDDDRRMILELVLDRPFSQHKLYVSRDVLDQLGTRAEHFTDAALDASAVGICGSVNAANIHSSLAWHVYQDSAMAGSLIIRKNKRLRRQYILGSKNEHRATPLLLLQWVTAAVTLPSLLFLIQHRVAVYGFMVHGLMFVYQSSTLLGRLLGASRLLCPILRIWTQLFGVAYIDLPGLIQYLAPSLVSTCFVL